MGELRGRVAGIEVHVVGPLAAGRQVLVGGLETQDSQVLGDAQSKVPGSPQDSNRLQVGGGKHASGPVGRSQKLACLLTGGFNTIRHQQCIFFIKALTGILQPLAESALAQGDRVDAKIRDGRVASKTEFSMAFLKQVFGCQSPAGNIVYHNAAQNPLRIFD